MAFFYSFLMNASIFVIPLSLCLFLPLHVLLIFGFVTGPGLVDANRYNTPTGPQSRGSTCVCAFNEEEQECDASKCMYVFVCVTCLLTLASAP